MEKKLVEMQVTEEDLTCFLTSIENLAKNQKVWIFVSIDLFYRLKEVYPNETKENSTFFYDGEDWKSAIEGVQLQHSDKGANKWNRVASIKNKGYRYNK